MLRFVGEVVGQGSLEGCRILDEGAKGGGGGGDTAATRGEALIKVVCQNTKERLTSGVEELVDEAGQQRRLKRCRLRRETIMKAVLAGCGLTGWR